MDRVFEGLDMLANLTEDIPDFWGLMDPVPAPDALSTIFAGDTATPQLPTPFDGGYPPAGNSSTVSPAFESLFPSTHELEEPIPLSDLASLHQKYFDIFYPVLSILNPSRFRREWAHDPGSPQIRALSYAVALVGSTVAPEYTHLQSSCYSNARKYIELCERDDDETHITSLNAFQALLFVLRYELTRKHFGAFQIRFAWDERDPASLEEIRRSFWSLYIFGSYGCVRIGRPCSLDDDDSLCIFLPSPGELNETFRPSPMPFIGDTTPIGIVDSLRLLRAALDQVEESDGYSHQASGAAVTALAKWDKQQRETLSGE